MSALWISLGAIAYLCIGITVVRRWCPPIHEGDNEDYVRAFLVVAWPLSLLVAVFFLVVMLIGSAAKRRER